MIICFPIQAANEHLKQVISNASEEAFSDSQSDPSHSDTVPTSKVYSFVLMFVDLCGAKTVDDKCWFMLLAAEPQNARVYLTPCSGDH